MPDRQRHQGAHPFWMAQSHDPRRSCSPVVSDDMSLVGADVVEDGGGVGDARSHPAGVDVAGLVRAPEASQAGGDDSVSRLDQGRDLVAPQMSRIGPPVEHQHHRAVFGSVIGDEDAEIPDVEETRRGVDVHIRRLGSTREPWRDIRRRRDMRMNRLYLLAIALLLAACGSGADGEAPDGTVSLPGEPVCLGQGDEAPDFVGLTEQEAIELAEDRGLQVREVGRDGECFPVTMDLRSDRVNLEFIGDVVVGAAIY